MYIGELISKYRKENGLSMETFARKCNLSKGYISMLEKNSNPATKQPIVPSLETIKAVSSAMGIDFNDVIATLDGNPPITCSDEAKPTAIVQNVGKIAAFFSVMPKEDCEFSAIPSGWLHGRSPNDFFVAIVDGDSMFPQFQNGDYLLCLKCKDMGESGHIGIIVLPDGVATLKRIEYKKGGDYIDLVPVNPMIPPQRISGAALEQCQVVGRVLRIMREIDTI